MVVQLNITLSNEKDGIEDVFLKQLYDIKYINVYVAMFFKHFEVHEYTILSYEKTIT